MMNDLNYNNIISSYPEYDRDWYDFSLDQPAGVIDGHQFPVVGKLISLPNVPHLHGTVPPRRFFVSSEKRRLLL